MKIVAKSALIKSQLQDKKDKGAEYIEVHMVHDNTIDVQKKSEGFIEMVEEIGLEVNIIHMPIEDRYNIDYLCNDELFNNIEKTFYLANEFGKKYNKKIIVIMHMTNDLELFKLNGTIDKIVERTYYLLNTYSFTEIAVENLTITSDKSDNYRTRINYYLETLELSNYIESKINKKIYFVLDTCHAIASIRIVEKLARIGVAETMKLEDFFYKSKERIKVIHLSNCRGMGIGEGHGIEFTTEDEIDLLKYMLKLIKEIDFDDYLTLEVAEKDYHNSLNWLDTLNKVKRHLLE